MANIGNLARQSGKKYPLRVLRSAAGWYIGTLCEEGFPYSRESLEYYPSLETAEEALEEGTWTQKPHP